MSGWCRGCLRWRDVWRTPVVGERRADEGQVVRVSASSFAGISNHRRTGTCLGAVLHRVRAGQGVRLAGPVTQPPRHLRRSHRLLHLLVVGAHTGVDGVDHRLGDARVLLLLDPLGQLGHGEAALHVRDVRRLARPRDGQRLAPEDLLRLVEIRWPVGHPRRTPPGRPTSARWRGTGCRTWSCRPRQGHCPRPGWTALLRRMSELLSWSRSRQRTPQRPAARMCRLPAPRVVWLCSYFPLRHTTPVFSRWFAGAERRGMRADAGLVHRSAGAEPTTTQREFGTPDSPKASRALVSRATLRSYSAQQRKDRHEP